MARRKPKKEPPRLRVRLIEDPDPDFSWLEQWDTPEKYYGDVPKCSHGIAMKYKEGHTWTSDHEVFDDDTANYVPCPDGEKFWDSSEVPDKGSVALDPKGHRGLGPNGYVPFDVYMDHWGNPNNHVALACFVEIQCPCCASWKVYDSLHNIDFMISDASTWEVGTFSEEDVKKLPDEAGLRSIVEECIENARHEFKKEHGG